PKQFSYQSQMTEGRNNQLPYCTMMRRRVLERTRGWRERPVMPEDADLWCRASSLGFRVGRATDSVTLVGRIRTDSVTSRTGAQFKDWTQWYSKPPAGPYPWAGAIWNTDDAPYVPTY